MSGDDLATALTTGGAAWMVLSISAVLPILWAFTLVLHFARPYIVRFLGTLTLRFGGDVWWLGYVLFRDALMVLTLALSVIFLMPNLYIGLGLPVYGLGAAADLVVYAEDPAADVDALAHPSMIVRAGRIAGRG